MKIQTTAASFQSVQLLEQMRQVTPPLQTMGGPGTGGTDAKSSDIETFIKLIKLDDAALKAVLGGLGVAITGIGAIAGAALFVYEIYKKFFADDGIQETLDLLTRIEALIQGLYAFESFAELRQQKEKVTGWQQDCLNVESALQNYHGSPSEDHRRALTDAFPDLARAISEMLSAGDIPFRRATYSTLDPTGAHWIDAARPPWMIKVGGGTVNIGPDLSTQLWDAGWFLVTLTRALILYPTALVLVEPAARSTGENRVQLVDIYARLKTFADNWQNSMLVSNIPGWVNPGGRMSSPYDPAPFGIMVGAVDPTSGVTAVNYGWGWNELQIEQRFDKSIFADGTPDWSVAHKALEGIQSATVLQSALLSRVMRRSGYWEMRRLEWAMRDLLSPFEGSTFVDLSDPVFQQLGMIEPGEGNIKPEITNHLEPYFTSSKDYTGQRFFHTPQKTFGFDAARRMEVSQIQLGYRINIAGEVIDLIPFSRAPIGGGELEYFPTEPINRVIEREIEVFDCFQADHLTPAQEDEYERLGSAPTVPRAIVNGRKGRLSIEVKISFAFDPNGPMPNSSGRIAVEVRARNPREFKDAAVVPIVVEEMRRVVNGPLDPGADLQTEWVKADEMTMLVAPSYMVIDRVFFDDLDRAFNAMLRDIKGLNDRFTLAELLEMGVPGPEPEPDPRFHGIAFDRRVQWAGQFLTAAKRAAPDDVQIELQRHRKGQIAGG